MISGAYPQGRLDATIGHRLHASRVGAGETSESLAILLGVSINLVSDWERGFARPSPKQIMAICDLLNVTPGSLFSDLA